MNNHYYPGGSPPQGGYGHYPSQGGASAPPPLPVSHARPIRRNANIVAGGLLLLEIVSYFAAVILSELIHLLLPGGLVFRWYSSLTQFLYLFVHSVGFAIPITVMVALIGIPAKVAFPVRKVRLGDKIPMVLFALGTCFVGVTLSVMLAGYLESAHGVIPTMSEFQEPEGIAAKILFFLSVAVSPAIFEELMFRGVIMQSLRRYGDGFALVTSSILFALCHGNLVQGPNALLMGLAIGYFVLRTGSITMGILIHFINNGLSAVISLVAYQNEPLADVLYLLLILVYIFGGIISGVYLLCRRKHMFRTLPSPYPMLESGKYFAFFFSFLPVLYVAFVIYYRIRPTFIPV